MWEIYDQKGMMIFREKILSYCPILEKKKMIIFLGNMKKLLFNEPIQKLELYKGYVKGYKSDVYEERARWRVEEQFNGHEVFDKDFLDYFRKILELCNEHNVKVVGITFPYTNYYMKYSDKYITKDVLQNKIINNADYSKYIYKYFDYMEIFADQHSLFYNPDHLNYDGARELAKLTTPELSEIMKEISNGI
jgi:hypothetical protein